MHGVGVESLTLNEDICGEESVSPGVGLTSKERQPGVFLREDSTGGCRETVHDLVVKLRHGQSLNIDLIAGLEQLTTEVLDNGDLRLVIAIDILEQVLDMTLVYTVKNLLDRLVNLGGVLDGHGTLEDTGSANILANNGCEILRLPERILLEEELEAGIESRDEWHRLLTAALAELDEVLNILGVDELLVGFRVGGKELVHNCERLVHLGVVLDKRALVGSGSQTLLNTTDEVDSKSGKRRIDPTLLLLDVHQLDHAADNLTIGHVLKVNGNASRVATEPNLLEVVVELLDDVVTVLLELGNALGLVKGEDLLIHLCPEQNTTGGKLVDRLTHLRADGDNTTSSTLVGLLPVGIVETGGINDSLLGSRSGLSLLSDHDTTTEQDTIERHGRVAELACPLTGQVRVGVLGSTETTSSNEDEVGALADSAIHLEHRLMEVLERVVTTTATTSPLHDDREAGVGLGNVDT